jgi:hypothetical protein
VPRRAIPHKNNEADKWNEFFCAILKSVQVEQVQHPFSGLFNRAKILFFLVTLPGLFWVVRMERKDIVFKVEPSLKFTPTKRNPVKLLTRA